MDGIHISTIDVRLTTKPRFYWEEPLVKDDDSHFNLTLQGDMKLGRLVYDACGWRWHGSITFGGIKLQHDFTPDEAKACVEAEIVKFLSNVLKYCDVEVQQVIK